MDAFIAVQTAPQALPYRHVGSCDTRLQQTGHKRYARNGSIITFHDSLKSIDKLRTALPESLQWLEDQGYTFKVLE